jgi:hypothetical protein
MKRDNPYQRDQRDIYISAARMGLVQMALDALWRAASEANLLAPDEVNYQHFTTARILALLDGLGWEQCRDTWLDSGLGI